MNSFYRAFSHDVTVALLVFRNDEAAAMLVYQTNPVGWEVSSFQSTLLQIMMLV